MCVCYPGFVPRRATSSIKSEVSVTGRDMGSVTCGELQRGWKIHNLFWVTTCGGTLGTNNDDKGTLISFPHIVLENLSLPITYIISSEKDT